MEMEHHVRILGVLYVIYGVLLLILAGCLFALLSGIGFMSGDRDAAWILSGVGVFVAAIVAILSVPTIITGIGLQRHRPWARIVALVLAAFKLLNFPIGTSVAVYAFWVLLNQQTEPLFAHT